MTYEIIMVAAMIARWIREGQSMDAIRERMANPHGVLQGLIEQAHERRQRGREYLGRG